MVERPVASFLTTEIATLPQRGPGIRNARTGSCRKNPTVCPSAVIPVFAGFRAYNVIPRYLGLCGEPSAPSERGDLPHEVVTS